MKRLLLTSKGIKRSRSSSGSNHCRQITAAQERIFWATNTRWINASFLVAKRSPFASNIDDSEMRSDQKIARSSEIFTLTCRQQSVHILSKSYHLHDSLQLKEHQDDGDKQPDLLHLWNNLIKKLLIFTFPHFQYLYHTFMLFFMLTWMCWPLWWIIKCLKELTKNEFQWKMKTVSKM